ncbi:MAG: hypothetical protein ACYTBJ_20260 [Planctomycetota bacterium]|jgi:hypothetical protein
MNKTGFPIFVAVNERTVLDVRNEDDLRLVRNILQVRDRAEAMLADETLPRLTMNTARETD